MHISEECLRDLLSYVREIAARSPELTVKDAPTECELLLGYLATLTEEVGELSHELRTSLQMSFSEKKVAAFDKENLFLEATDVLLVILLLMERLGVENLDEWVYKKIGKNRERGY